MNLILAVDVDPMFSKFVLLSLVIILAGFVLRLVNQPSMITYILVGIVVGPYGLGYFTDEALVSNLGSLGLVLLLFFIGMEIHLPDIISNWKVSVIGSLIQVAISILLVWLASHYFNWSTKQIITFAFVISLSSTAVILKILQERDELATPVGQNVLGILLAQDILIVPMIIILGYLGGNHPGKLEIIKQLIGTVLIIGIIIYIIQKKEIKLPFRKQIEADHEIQVFLAFTLCFGFSILTAYLGLSSALGAFVAGIVISSAKATKWVFDSLHSFKVMFMAIFFVSIGMLIDIPFIKEKLLTIIVLVALSFVIKNMINLFILRIFCKNWKNSFYGGALLAQIGEFSFILGSTGHFMGIIQDDTYKIIVSVIALSLFLSPLWISFARFVNRMQKNPE